MKKVLEEQLLGPNMMDYKLIGRLTFQWWRKRICKTEYR
jgi:hypothetical protein